MMRHRYTDKQLDFIREGYKRYRVPELTTMFNRRFGLAQSETAIKSAITNHGFVCGRKTGNQKGHSRIFSDEQVAFIKEHYRHFTAGDLTRELNRVFGASFTLGQIKCFVHNHGVDSGRSGHFEKGHKPWNTGTKGLTRENSGSFKKGRRPQTWMPVGSEALTTKDNYIKVKIAEPNVWEFMHKLVWREHYGEIPPGHVLLFKDSDRSNCSIENLELVTRAELLLLTRRKYHDLPLELRETMLATVRLECRQFAMVRELEG